MVVFVIVLLGSALGVAALGRETLPEGTIPPGVRIAGASVGGMLTDDARSRLDQHLESVIKQPVTLVYGDRSWNPSMSDLGAAFSIDRSINEAVAYDSRIERIKTRMFGVKTKDVPLYLSFEQDSVEHYVASIAAEINRDPSIPDLALENGVLVLSEPEPGVRVDEAPVVEQIESSLLTLNHTTIDVPVTLIEVEFTEAEMQAVTRAIEQALTGPVTITFEDRAWHIHPETIAELISMKIDDSAGGDDRVSLAIHSNQLLAHMIEIIGDMNRPAVNASVAWGGSGVVALSASQTGVQIDIPGTLAAVEQAIFSDERTVTLNHQYVSPAINSNNLGELGVTSLIASGQSYYWNSSPSRAHNIAVAASHIDGTVIPPGAEFSFNQAIGPITAERGYQEGYVILAEQTVPGVGGGVCQVSTTVFRAAFFAGLPITERHPHAYIVGFYEDGGWPLGFDAAIFQPHADLRFVNTTGSYMILHTRVVDNQLFVNLYGSPTGWEVSLNEPVIQNQVAPPPDVEIFDSSLPVGARHQVEWAKQGMDVTLSRTVTKDGQVIREDYFFSSFQPWGNRYMVGPSPAPPPPPPAPAAGSDDASPPASEGNDGEAED